MKKLLLFTAISLFSIAITNCMEQDKTSEIKHIAKEIENLTRDDLKDKSVTELNRISNEAELKIKQLNEKTFYSIPEFLRVLKYKPFPALKEELNQKIVKSHDEIIKLFGVIKLISQLKCS